MKLSIITPTFNRADVIKRNLESVSSQTYQDIEHIIVDNESSDGTEKLIDKYIKSVKYNVIYIRESDTGIYNAMNKGIRKAAGEWIHILNSDDYYYDKNVLEKIFEGKDLTNFDLLANAIIQKSITDDWSKLWIPEMRYNLKYHYFPHPGIIIRKDFYERNGYYNEKYKIVADAVYNAKNYCKAKYIIIKEPLTVMVLGGISSNNFYRLHFEELLCRIFYYKWPLNIKIKKILDTVFEICGFTYGNIISNIKKSIRKIIKKTT